MPAIDLGEEIGALVNGALMSGNPIILASVDEASKPRLSFRGSTQVLTKDQLGIWVRNAEGATLTAIRNHPNVALMYRRPTPIVILQFAGRARIAEGAERDRVYDLAPEVERKSDPDRKGVAVVVELDSVQGILGLDDAGARRIVNQRRE